MPQFVWEGKTRQGESRAGTMEAKSRDDVLERLKAQQISASKVKRKPMEIHLKLGQRRQQEGHRRLHAAVRHDDRRRPAAGAVPRHPRLPAGQRSLPEGDQQREDGRRGRLHASPTRLGKHPKVFDDLYVNLVAAGEVGGILDTILNRLATYIEKSLKLKRQVKGAMVYPSVVMVRRHRRDRGAPHLRDPGVREDVQGLRRRRCPRRPSSSSTCRTGSARTSSRSSWRDRAVRRLKVVGPHAARASDGRRRHPQGARVRARSSARSPWPASRARSARCSPRACPSSTRSTSGADSAGNKVVENAIMYARERISEGKDMAEPLAETGCSRRWSCR